jgi:ferrochelatase
MSSATRIGVLVAQLGTPDAPTARALRPYLRQFLSDRRVIDYPPALWQPLLRGVILNTRPKRSARLYNRIWLHDGSPLRVYSVAQVEGLQARLGDHYRVMLGMRYGTPSIATAIQTLETEGIDRIIVLPMYPQYSSTTTASIYDAVYAAAGGTVSDRKRFVPSLRFIAPYYDHPAYIGALKTHLERVFDGMTMPPDHMLITFHGIPHRYTRTGDPYRAHCERSAMLLADAMGWRDDQWSLSFQSQFGPEKWLEPYTDQVLEGLAHRGVHRPLVFAPGFVTDCLETLDELGNEGRDQFAEGGGDPAHFTLAPCLNDSAAWLNAMTALVLENAGGWDGDIARVSPSHPAEFTEV